MCWQRGIRIETDSGESLSYDFEPDRITHTETMGFFHMVPISWFRHELKSIHLSAPDGTEAVLDRSTDEPYTIVMQDGQVVYSGPEAPTGITGEIISTRGIPRR